MYPSIDDRCLLTLYTRLETGSSEVKTTRKRVRRSQLKTSEGTWGYRVEIRISISRKRKGIQIKGRNGKYSG